MPFALAPRRRHALLSAALALALAAGARPAAAQSTLDVTPNLKGTWTLRPGTGTFVFAHRFVLLRGGDEVFNFPTLTLGVGLPAGFTLGADHATNTETVAGKAGGNETEFWLKRAFPVGHGASVAGVAAYNTAARSVDGALTARVGAGRVSLLGEARAFSRTFGTEGAGLAAGAGAVVHLNRFVGLVGDVGRMLSADTFGTVWSGGLAVAIPGSPHTLSLYASNGSVGTLQGASHPRALFPHEVRYGFTFVVPLGDAKRWTQIVRPPPARPAPAPSADTAQAAAAVQLKDEEFGPHEVRIHPGQSVRWTNLDDRLHSVVADDGSWASPDMARDGVFVKRFDRPGRYPYYCEQHPDMTGVVIVE